VRAFPRFRGSSLPYAVLAGGQVAVGAAAIFARFGLSGAPPLAVAAARLAIASIVLLALDAALRHAQDDTAAQDDSAARNETSATRFVFPLAGFALALHFATWIWSLEYTSVAISTLLVATSPVWTALYDALIRRVPISPLAWLALAAGIAGLVLVTRSHVAPPPVAGHVLLGDLLALAGAFAIGAYFLLIRDVRAHCGTRTIVTRTYSWAAVFLIAAALAAHQTPPALSNTAAWGGILAMALISQLLGHSAMNAALRWFSASAVAMSTLIEPVVAALLAYAIFSEAIAPLAIVGGALILIAVAVFLREETTWGAIPRS
jgi:drug/metabolite transporter (DMT)-like permease